MNQANENLAVQETQEEKVEQQPEQKTMVEEFRENNPKESEEETNEPITHMENTEEEDEQEEYEMPSFFEGIENHWHKDGPDLEGIVQELKDTKKNYTELRTKMSQGKHKAPEKYNTDFLKEYKIQEDDPLLNGFIEIAKENGLSQLVFDDAVKLVLENQKEQAAEIDRNSAEEKRLLGKNADAILNSNLDWADGMQRKGIFNKDEVSELDMLGGTAVGSKLIIKLRNLMGDKVTIPTRLETPELKESEDEFKAETTRLMNDSRYKTDPSFQNMVAKRFTDRYGNKNQ
tara:strand:- start:4241 stop:5104 length:864 start_codon:yes stop_codon:yes gene_type:complete